MLIIVMLLLFYDVGDWCHPLYANRTVSIMQIILHLTEVDVWTELRTTYKVNHRNSNAFKIFLKQLACSNRVSHVEASSCFALFVADI